MGRPLDYRFAASCACVIDLLMGMYKFTKATCFGFFTLSKKSNCPLILLCSHLAIHIFLSTFTFFKVHLYLWYTLWGGYFMDNWQSLSDRFFSVIDDLHTYYKQAERNSVSIMTPQQAFELAANLWTTFCNARDNYLTLCQVSFCPPALEYPFLFFYRHPSNGSIHTVYSYPYELSKKSNLLSLKGFRYFLINVCNLPYINCPDFRQLFYALHSLIENYPYDSTTTIMNQLKMYAPRIAANLEKPNFLRYLPKRTFIFLMS